MASVTAVSESTPGVSIHRGALAPVADFRPNPAWVAAGLARLDPLLPDAPSPAAARDLPLRALAYVERYGHEMPLIEHEWQLLYAALLIAWQREADDSVIRLVAGLAPVAGRLRHHALAERILHLGIGASRRMQDRSHLVAFLNRLAGLLCAHGYRDRGARLWRTSLRLAASLPQGLWEPLHSFAMIVDMTPGPTAARQLVATMQGDEPASHLHHEALAVALFARGLSARVNNDLARAREDYTASLRLLARIQPEPEIAPAAPCVPPADRQLFTLAIQAELARTHNDYPRSRAYTATALALARVSADHYTRAALLVDQALYAHHLGRHSDAYAALVGLRAVMRRMAAPHVYENTRQYLEHQIGEQTLPSGKRRLNALVPHVNVAQRSEPSAPLLDPLSAREREVLALVAAGLSNCELASHLVITVGTVKKHLEHIYTKLGAGSRTAAVARARLHRLL